MRVWFAVLLGLFFIMLRTAAAETFQPAVPIDRPAPEYPLLPDDLEGYVKLHFTIDRDGHVKDAAPIESTPPGVFDAAAIAGMAQWRYKPRIVDGVPADQPDNTILLRFKPSSDRPPVLLNPRPPYYPQSAYDTKTEGSVTVAYDINKQGMTNNIKILESSTPNIFNEEALRYVKDRVFRPATVNGSPQSVSGLKTVVDFKLSNAVIAPKLIKLTKPLYPTEAEDKGIMGYCEVIFIVESDGSISNPVVTISYPRGVFEAASLYAIKSWKFEPAINTKGPVSQKTHYLFNYIIEGTIEKDLNYLKPGQWVKLDFTLRTDGIPTDIKVVETSDSTVHTRDAIDQLRKSKLSPHMENGQPVTVPHQTIKIVGPNE